MVLGMILQAGRLPGRAAIIATVLLFAGSAANGDIVTDRPDVAESSETVGQWRFQIETGFDVETYRGEGARVTAFRTPTKLRLGLLDDLEIHLETDGFSWDRGVGATVYGFSDVALGFKAHMIDGGQLAGVVPSMAMLGAVTLNSGTHGFSGGGSAPAAVLAMDWGLPLGIDLGSNLGIELPVDEGDHRFLRGFYAVALSRPWTPLSRQVRSYVEVFGDLAASGPARTTANVDGGFAYTPTGTVQLDLSFRMGITEGTPDFGVGTGFSVKL